MEIDLLSPSYYIENMTSPILKAKEKDDFSEHQKVEYHKKVLLLIHCSLVLILYTFHAIIKPFTFIKLLKKEKQTPHQECAYIHPIYFPPLK